MARTFQFDEFESTGKAPGCIACEEMLAEALDESLGEADRAWFDRHVNACTDCRQMLADAQRGAAWLELLKSPRPEPSAHLMERILAQTSGMAGLPDSTATGQTLHEPRMVPAAAPLLNPVAMPANLLQFRPNLRRMPRFARLSTAMFEPRLAMTAAMAFFSIALTLNLTGVQLNRVRVSDLKPANLKRTYYEANAEATRYYENLRVVRVMQSRVDDLRETNSDDFASPAPRQEPKPQPLPETKPAAPESKPGASADPQEPAGRKPEAGPGVSQREAPSARPQFLVVDDKMRRNGHAAAALKNLNRTREEGGLV